MDNGINIKKRFLGTTTLVLIAATAAAKLQGVTR